MGILEKIFSKPGKVKHGNIHLLAILLSALYRYHADFAVRVIDNVIESVCFGLEQNDFNYNRRRIAEVKYLGELYNYRMLEHPVIFDTMYKIMTFGHGGPPVPGRPNPFDLPDDFFRIRLIATVLETCGMYFNRGSAGKKLDYFLSFFQVSSHAGLRKILADSGQYYIHTKHPLPMDIEFTIQDIFALTRPQWKLASNFEEASKAFSLAVVQNQKSSGLDKSAEPDEASSGPSSDDEMGDDLPMPDADSDSEEDMIEVSHAGPRARDSTSSNRDFVLQDADPQLSQEDSETEDEAIVVTREEEEVDPEEEADFEREYAKMMAESLESRKFDRKQVVDIAIPVRSKPRDSSALEAGEGGDGPPMPTMAFSLLTKKGNRQQVRRCLGVSRGDG